MRAGGLKYPAVFQQSGGTIRLVLLILLTHLWLFGYLPHRNRRSTRVHPPKKRAMSKWVVLAHGSEKLVSELSWCQLGFVSVAVVFQRQLGLIASERSKHQHTLTDFSAAFMLVVFQTLTQKQEKSFYWSCSLVVYLSLKVHSVCLKLTMSSMDPPPTGWHEQKIKAWRRMNHLLFLGQIDALAWRTKDTPPCSVFCFLFFLVTSRSLMVGSKLPISCAVLPWDRHRGGDLMYGGGSKNAGGEHSW